MTNLELWEKMVREDVKKNPQFYGDVNKDVKRIKHLWFRFNGIIE